MQETLLAERRELGNNLAERKVESAWPGKATACGSVNATISMCPEFLVGTRYNRANLCFAWDVQRDQDYYNQHDFLC